MRLLTPVKDVLWHLVLLHRNEFALAHEIICQMFRKRILTLLFFQFLGNEFGYIFVIDKLLHFVDKFCILMKLGQILFVIAGDRATRCRGCNARKHCAITQSACRILTVHDPASRTSCPLF